MNKTIINMEQEDFNKEKEKEIEWLMGSIQRSYSRVSGDTIFILIVFGLLAVIGGVFYLLNFNDNNIGEAALVIVLIVGFISSIVIGFVFRKKIARAETPQRLLTLHDRLWVIQAILFTALIGGSYFLMNGSIVSKVCFMLAIALLVIASWLSMNNRLRLWVAVGMLIFESVLLFYSKIELLVGLPILLCMLSIMMGKNSLFTSNNKDNEDAETDQEIKQLRELVNNSEHNIQN